MLNGIIRFLLLLAALVVFVSILNAWGPVALLVNVIIALVLLKVLGWLGVEIEVNIWSVLIILVGGVLGLLALVFLSITGIAFRKKR